MYYVNKLCLTLPWANKFDLSPFKSLGFMIMFIIMKEIWVSIDHTLGIKLIIIMCLVSKGCTKGSLCRFQPFEGQIKCQVYLLQTYLKVRSISISTSCTNKTSLCLGNTSRDILLFSVPLMHHVLQVDFKKHVYQFEWRVLPIGLKYGTVNWLYQMKVD